MISKTYLKSGETCRVTFRFKPDIEVDSAYLCGDFNDWNPMANPMKRLKDGDYSITLSLHAGGTYSFKYLLDGRYWQSDPQADGYVGNIYGTENSLISV